MELKTNRQKSQRYPDPSVLETFANPQQERDYHIHIVNPEFTCLCPISGNPDFARLELSYVPDRRCLELKALKIYFQSFRNTGAFHEAVTNQIVDDLVDACRPKQMRLVSHFNRRGGIRTTVVAWYPKAPDLSENSAASHQLSPNEQRSAVIDDR